MAISMEEDATLTQLLGELEPELPKMSAWAQGFISDQIKRHRQYGTDIFMSAKQWAMIRKLHDEHVGTGEPEAPPPVDDRW
jgi:hypothetical protein